MESPGTSTEARRKELALECSLDRPMLIPTSLATAEISAKKSRFIGTVTPVFSPQEAQEALTALARPDATHNCFAWQTGPSHRYSDDGEPGGTAGRPIYAVLEGAGLNMALVVVTRYFGGIKLGSGGLVRAYSQAASACLAQVPKKTLIPKRPVTLRLPFGLSAGVFHLLDRHALVPFGQTYTPEGFELSLFVPAAGLAAFYDDMNNLCRGRFDIETGTLYDEEQD